jgi:hypothetical protein
MTDSFVLWIRLVQQSVKDVLQSLVDDGLVTVEKIGTSNYYWSFPSTIQQSVRTKERTIHDNTQQMDSIQE